jgi:chromosomal replication initiator protein
VTAVHGTLSVYPDVDDPYIRRGVDAHESPRAIALDAAPADAVVLAEVTGAALRDDAVGDVVGDTDGDSPVLRIARRIAAAVGGHRFGMWFERSARLAWCERRHCLEVTVPNRFVADWIGRHFQGQMAAAARAETDGPVNVTLRVDASAFTGRVHTPGAGGPAAAGAGVGADADASRGALPRRPIRRRPMAGQNGGRARHHLDDFVVGPSNRLAYEAARRLAEADVPTGSPLFLHGGVGLGKTHLLQGICQRMREAHPHARVLYTTAEQFTNAFLAAVRGGQLEAFRRRYRQLDLLAIDDVHFIANKQATQQEFLHSFDAIDLAGARVALASDSHPRQIHQFSDALINRCLRGMVVEIQPPDTGTRARIVAALAQRRGINLRETVVAMLAQRCRGSVRELEGTLVKLHALAQLAGEPAGAQPRHGEQQQQRNPDQPCGDSGGPVIGHVLASQLFERPRTPSDAPVRFGEILEQVSQATGVAAAQINGRGRRGAVVTARSLTAYMARQLTGMSYPEIAAALGRGSHSTVLAAVQRVERQLAAGGCAALADGQADVPLRELVDGLRARLSRR